VELILHGLGTALMSNFRAIDRETGFLLPPSVDECFLEALARFVVEVIDGLEPVGDGSELSRSGSALRIIRRCCWAFGVRLCDGVFFGAASWSARPMIPVAFRFITATSIPTKNTDRTFPGRFKEIEGLFCRVLELAREMACSRWAR